MLGDGRDVVHSLDGDFPETTAYVRAVLATSAEQLAAYQARVAEVEADGYRVVDGGPLGEPDAFGRSRWSITDYRTEEVLAEGHGTDADYEAATRLLQDELGQRFWHIDPLTEGVNHEHPEFLDGPESDLKDTRLGHLLFHWVLDNEDGVRAWVHAGADPEVIRQAVAWASAKLKRLSYLEDEGYGLVLVVGPLDDSNGSAVGWNVYSWPGAARPAGGFKVGGDRAELDSILEREHLLDVDSVQASPLPDGLAGSLARELSTDQEALDDLVREYPCDTELEG